VLDSKAPDRGSVTDSAKLPRYVVFGEALTDMLLQEARSWRAAPGGSCWNVARTASRMGVSTGFAGCVSCDIFGDDLALESERAGLDSRFLQRAKAPPLLAIIPSIKPPHYFFLGEGAADLKFDPAKLPKGWRETVEIVHFGGISLARKPLADILINEAVLLHQRGVPIAFDPNFRELMRDHDYAATFDRLASLSSYIKVSEEDLHGLFESGTLDHHVAALRDLAPSATILLTRGERGMSLYRNDEVFHQSAFPTTLIDTVGCGDAAMGGWVVALLENELSDVESQLRMAAACAAVTASKSGPYAASRNEVNALLQG